MRKGDVEQGLRRSRVGHRARVHQPVGAARPDGDARRHRAVEGRRRGHHLVERAVAVHRAQPVLRGDAAADEPGSRRHPACRRRLRRQGRHSPRAAPRLPFARRRRTPGEDAGDPRGGVQPPAVPQRADVSHQDRCALRRKDHRAADDDALGRRRLRRLRGQRHARLELLRGRSVRDPQRLARRVHHLHQQALRHGLSRVRSRRVLLGSRAAHGTGRSRDRHGPAGIPAEEPPEARLVHADRREDPRQHRQSDQVPRAAAAEPSTTGSSRPRRSGTRSSPAAGSARAWPRCTRRPPCRRSPRPRPSRR